MPASLTDVTVHPPDRTRLPDWASEYAVIVRLLESTGRLDDLAHRLQLPRSGGYSGLDLVLFLLAFFCWGRSSSLSEFAAESSFCGPQLAALAGRSSWPTQPSVSRALAVADRCDLDAFGAWLLGPGSAGADLLAHPLAMAADTYGNRLCVLDFDPTVEALRLRALPDTAELPSPRRHSGRLCAPGYCGRKRGETQFSITPVASAGTGLWLQAGVEPGNCDIAKAVEVCAGAVEAALSRAGIAPERAVVRIDGAGGFAQAVHPLARRGIHFLVRLKRYAILGLPQVRTLMDQGVWATVPDSGSGPRRQALDLGRWQLGAEGSDGPVVDTRLVASRFATDHKHGAGTLIDGWHYELFGTSLDPSAWPAAETVELYCGRAVLENRFAQEAADLHLHHVFSYHPAGQRLAVLVGLWLWNLRTVLGSRVAGPLGEVPAQPARKERAAPEGPPPLPAAEPVGPVVDEPPLDSRTQLEIALLQLPWQNALRKHPGWTHAGQLRCPAGHTATFHGIKQAKKRYHYAYFKVSSKHCGVCPQRSGCTNSPDPGYTPQITVALADALPMGTRMRDHKPAPPPPKPVRWQPPEPSSPGPYQAMAAPLLPAVLRRQWRRLVQHSVVHVQRPAQPPRGDRRPWVAAMPAQRQHRRLTWQQHLARYALAGKAAVRVAAPDKGRAQAVRAVLQALVA